MGFSLREDWNRSDREHGKPQSDTAQHLTAIFSRVLEPMGSICGVVPLNARNKYTGIRTNVLKIHVCFIIYLVLSARIWCSKICLFNSRNSPLAASIFHTSRYCDPQGLSSLRTSLLTVEWEAWNILAWTKQAFKTELYGLNAAICCIVIVWPVGGFWPAATPSSPVMDSNGTHLDAVRYFARLLSCAVWSVQDLPESRIKAEVSVLITSGECVPSVPLPG